MSCAQNPIETILGTECIGDSLPKINGNFSVLGNTVCELLTAVDYLENNAITRSDLELRLQDVTTQTTFIEAESFNSLSKTSVARTATEWKKIITAAPTTITADTTNDASVNTTSNVYFHFYPYGTDTLDDGSKTIACGFLPPRSTFTPSGNLPLPYATFTVPVQESNVDMRLEMLCTSNKIGPNFVGQTNPLKTSTNSLNYPVYAVEMDPDNPNSGWIGGNFTTGPAARIRSFSSVSIGNATPTFGSLPNLTIGNGTVHALKFFKVNDTRYLAIGGSFTNTGGGASRLLIYNLSTSTVQRTYVLNNLVRCINFFDNKLYIGGRFTTLNDGQLRVSRGFATINVTNNFSYDDTITDGLGLSDPDFMVLPTDANGAIIGEVNSIQKVTVGDTNLLFIAGYFSYRSGGTSKTLTNTNILAVNLETNTRYNWNYATYGRIYNTLLTNIGGNTKLSLMGTFTKSSGNSGSPTTLYKGRARFLRLNISNDGQITEDLAYYPSFNGDVYEAIQIRNTDFVLVRGNFSKVGGSSFGRLCYLDFGSSTPVANAWNNGAKQTLDTGWVSQRSMHQLTGNFTFVNINPAGTPSTLQVTDPTLIGGTFTKVNGIARNRLTLFAAPPGLTIVGDTPTQVTFDLSVAKVEELGTFLSDEDDASEFTTTFDLPYQGQFEFIPLNFPSDYLETLEKGDIARIRIRRQRHVDANPTILDMLLVFGVRCTFLKNLEQE